LSSCEPALVVATREPRDGRASESCRFGAHEMPVRQYLPTRSFAQVTPLVTPDGASFIFRW
jgi:hypothetical protein